MNVMGVASPASALALFKADVLSLAGPVLMADEPALRALDAATVDPGATPVEAALQILDPGPRTRLSLKTAHAIHDLVEKLRSQIRRPDMPSDQAFAAAMGDTPARYSELMKSRGATRWVWHPEEHLTGGAYFRALSIAIPRQYDTPGSVAEALFIPSSNKHPLILKGSDVPEAGLVSGTYDMYDDKGFIGSFVRKDCNEAYFADFEATHPNQRIMPFYFGNDTAIIIWDR